MLVVGIVAVVLFAASSFYLTRVAERIRLQLHARHADLLLQIAPSENASWAKHWSWQNPFNVALAALPHIDGLGDDALSGEAGKLRAGLWFSYGSFAVLFVAFGYLFIR